MQEFKGKIVEKKYLTAHTLEITVQLLSPTDITFVAGQFMEFKIGERLKAFSIVSAPEQKQYLQFCVALYDKGIASEYFKGCKIGSEVTLGGPRGNFVVQNFTRNIFFVASGVGIAPFCSIIPELLTRGFGKKLKLLFGVRSEADVFYFDRFNYLKTLYKNFTFTPILSQPRSHWPGETGRVTTYLDVAYDYYKDYVYYICGSERMATDTRALLLTRDHDVKDIKLEIFT